MEMETETKMETETESPMEEAYPHSRYFGSPVKRYITKIDSTVSGRNSECAASLPIGTTTARKHHTG